MYHLHYLHIILLYMILYFPLQLLGKETEHVVQGSVVDNMTGKGVPAHVILMRADSLVLDTTTAFVSDTPDMHRNEPYGAYYHFTIREVGHYIIKAKKEGYEEAFMEFDLHSNRERAVFVRTIRLQKINLLKEVVVKATKIKMVMRGDTIIYNADAFNLAEGSMLDELVARLPGVRLTKDGQIFVNGKYVHSLLVNGKDFFSGNPKLALRNLPAYTVKKIKVYDEAGPASRIMNRDMGDKVYVMDVRLKKNTGYFGNAETGAGSEKRYMAKAFAMEFSEKESLFSFTNNNNFSDTREATFEGEWTKPKIHDGLLANKTTNISYANYLNDRYNWYSSSNTFSHTDDDRQERTHIQSYLPSGDTWQKRNSNNISKATNIRSNNQFRYEKGSLYSLNSLNFRYSVNDGHRTSFQTLSDISGLINSKTASAYAKEKHLFLNTRHEGGSRILTDMIRWDVETEYEIRTPTQSSHEDFQYTSAPQFHDERDKWLNKLSQHSRLHTRIEYNLCWPKYNISAEYEYRFQYNKTSNLLYRLEKMNSLDSTSNIMMLPSAIEALNDMLDKGNSYRYHEYHNHHVIRLSLTGESSPHFYWMLKFPLRYVNKNLFYYRMGRHDVSKETVFLEPSLFSKGTNRHFSYELNIGITSSIPDMTSMIDYYDDSDPLNIRRGNPKLKNTHQYDMNVLMQLQGAHQQLSSLNLGYHLYESSVAFCKVFDRTTGVSSFQPVNVNGNWSTNASVGYTRAMDNSGKLTFDNQTRYDYRHGVDMVMLSGMEVSHRRSVNNHVFSEGIKLSYRSDSRYEIVFTGGGKYYLSYSGSEDFSNIHAQEYNIGANTSIVLWKRLQLNTNLTFMACRGYQQQDMNTTRWIWNAQLNYKFYKDILSVRILEYDILRQFSNIRYSINSQGHTETWTNSIPSYVIATMTWKFASK